MTDGQVAFDSPRGKGIFIEVTDEEGVQNKIMLSHKGALKLAQEILKKAEEEGWDEPGG